MHLVGYFYGCVTIYGFMNVKLLSCVRSEEPVVFLS
jgi:hypothetical protein